MSAPSQPTYLSVIVKCYNEAANIDAALGALTAATRDYRTEIVVVDSLSTDQSVAIASRYPVRIVQLASPNDRRCGAVAQLGYQFVCGAFVLLIDGDMELSPGFLPAALARFTDAPRLAGVGGLLIELSDGIEFRERQLRDESLPLAGEVEMIGGCGLYRRAAIEDVQYLTNRNLHCLEEYELGLRLRARGWCLRQIDVTCVRHHGHRDKPLKLLMRRWRTRFYHGYGELLRDALRRPWFLQALKPCRIALAVVLWWVTLLALAVAAFFAPAAAVAFVVVLVLPWVMLLLRKLSITRASHAFAVWQFSAASLIGGLLVSRTEPTVPLRAVVLKADAPSPG
jgi:glycosyltransferase involved in cell wall biosynthesis